MRILVITQFFAPDITAAAFRLTDFARLLAANQHEVRVVTTFPHKAHVEGVDDSQLLQSGIQVDRCHIRDVRGSGAKAYLLHYLSFVRGSIRLGTRIWWGGWRPDVIYVSSPPLFVGMAGRFLAGLFRRPIVFEVRDVWPDTAVAAGQLSQDGRAYRIGRAMERYFYRTACHITCVSRPMADYLRTQTKTPITVVYNGVPTPTADNERLVADHQLTDHRTILYAGNIGHLQELELLVEGFGQLCQEHLLNNWRLEILGDGAQRGNLIQQVRELGLEERILFVDPVDRDQAALRMRQSDLLYLNLKRSPTLQKTIPSKVFDYLLAARPIVAGIAGEGQSILQSTGANIVFEPGAVSAVRDAIRSAVENLDRLDASAQKNRELVMTRFTRECAYQTLEAVFQSIVDGGSPPTPTPTSV